MSTEAKSLRALIPAAIGFVVVTGALIVAIQVIGLDHIRDTIASAGVFAPLIYIFIKILTYVVAPLSSGPLQLSAGILFGLIPGTLYTLIGEVIGGSIAFWLSRRFGRSVVHRLVGEDGMTRVDTLRQPDRRLEDADLRAALPVCDLRLHQLRRRLLQAPLSHLPDHLDSRRVRPDLHRLAARHDADAGAQQPADRLRAGRHRQRRPADLPEAHPPLAQAGSAETETEI